jgi:hypothetical protein
MRQTCFQGNVRMGYCLGCLRSKLGTNRADKQYTQELSDMIQELWPFQGCLGSLILVEVVKSGQNFAVLASFSERKTRICVQALEIEGRGGDPSQLLRLHRGRFKQASLKGHLDMDCGVSLTSLRLIDATSEHGEPGLLDCLGCLVVLLRLPLGGPQKVPTPVLVRGCTQRQKRTMMRRDFLQVLAHNPLTRRMLKLLRTCKIWTT